MLTGFVKLLPRHAAVEHRVRLHDLRSDQRNAGDQYARAGRRAQRSRPVVSSRMDGGSDPQQADAGQQEGHPLHEVRTADDLAHDVRRKQHREAAGHVHRRSGIERDPPQGGEESDHDHGQRRQRGEQAMTQEQRQEVDQADGEDVRGYGHEDDEADQRARLDRCSGQQADPLHQCRGEERDGPGRQEDAQRLAQHQFQIGTGKRVQHLAHPLSLIAGPDVVGQKDQADHEQEEEVVAEAGDEVTRVDRRRRCGETRDEAVDEKELQVGQQADDHGEAGEDPEAHEPPRQTRLGAGNAEHEAGANHASSSPRTASARPRAAMNAR